MADTVTITSTSDSLEQVQAALGVEATPAAAAEPAKAPETPAPPVAAEPVEAPAAPVAPSGPALGDEDEDEGDEAPAAAAASDAPPLEKARKIKGKLQSRINELVEQRDKERGISAAHKSELDVLRARLDELVRQQTGAAPKTPEPETPAAPVEKPAPKVEDFETYEDYTLAVAEHVAEKIAAKKVQEVLASRDQGARQAAAERARDAAMAQYRDKTPAVRAKYDDFDEVVNRPDVPLSPVMARGLLTSDIGPEIAYYLGKHPDECKRIASITSPEQAFREFGRLEARVEAAIAGVGAASAQATPVAVAPAPVPTVAPTTATPAPAVAAPAPQARVTSAPDPIKPVGNGAATPTVPLDEMPYPEYKRLRAAQERASRGL